MNRIFPICLAVLSALAVPAQAATFTVTSLADIGAGSLRAAVEQANTATAAPHVVAFQPGLVGAIALASESKADIGAYEFRGDAFFHGDFELR